MIFFASLVTAMIVGHPVPVACDYVGGHEGFYDVRRDVIVLDPFVCVGFGSPTSTRPYAVALHALVHESEHARGVVVEGDAECAAMADLPRVVKRFRLPRRVLAFARAIHVGMPPAYQGAC